MKEPEKFRIKKSRNKERRIKIFRSREWSI